MNTETFKNIFIFFTKIFLFLLFLFGRTFIGIDLLGYRLGEILVGLSFVIFILYVLIFPGYKKKYFLDDKKLNLIMVILLISFIIFNFLRSISFTNLFIYQTSTYIWSIGALVLGYIFLDYFPNFVKKEDIILSLLGLFIIYIFSTRGISENLQNVFLGYTDKFEYPKGSDLLIVFIFVMYLLVNKLNFSFMSFNILLFTSALYVPLFLVKSRSGFISIVLFTILVLPRFREVLKKLDLRFLITIFLTSFIFLSSTSYVVSKNIAIDETISEELKFAITSRYKTINDNKYEKEVLELSLFYFQDGRIFTTDGNLNWRFQIWQDIFQDMYEERKIMFGYGFDDIVPAMDSDQRTGQDQQNINVHNYFVHVLSRGGLTHLSLVLIFYVLLFRKFKSINLHNDFFLLTLPLIFNSLFDPSMENAHYPLIFYFTLGLIIKKPILFKSDI